MSESERKRPCEYCDGTGLKVVSASFLDRIDETIVFCSKCQGTGRVATALDEKAEQLAPVAG